jgi:hypothetical protein
MSTPGITVASQLQLTRSQISQAERTLSQLGTVAELEKQFPGAYMRGDKDVEALRVKHQKTEQLEAELRTLRAKERELQEAVYWEQQKARADAIAALQQRMDDEVTKYTVLAAQLKQTYDAIEALDKELVNYGGASQLVPNWFQLSIPGTQSAQLARHMQRSYDQGHGGLLVAGWAR